MNGSPNGNVQNGSESEKSLGDFDTNLYSRQLWVDFLFVKGKVYMRIKGSRNPKKKMKEHF